MATTQAGQAATRATKKLQFAKARRIQLSLVFFTLPIIAALLKVFAFGLVLTVVSLLFLIPLFIMGFDLVKGVGTTWNIHKEEEPLVRLIAMSLLIGTLLIGGYNFYANSTYYNPINKRQVEGGFVPQLLDNAAILQLLFTGQYEDQFGKSEAHFREVIERKRADARTRYLRDRFNIYRMFGKWNPVNGGGNSLNIQRDKDRRGKMTLSTAKNSLKNVFFRLKGETGIMYGSSQGDYTKSMSFSFVNDHTLELNLTGETTGWQRMDYQL